MWHNLKVCCLTSKIIVGVPHLDVESNDAIILGFMIAEYLEEV